MKTLRLILFPYSKDIYQQRMINTVDGVLKVGGVLSLTILAISALMITGNVINKCTSSNVHSHTHLSA